MLPLHPTNLLLTGGKVTVGSLNSTPCVNVAKMLQWGHYNIPVFVCISVLLVFCPGSLSSVWEASLVFMMSTISPHQPLSPTQVFGESKQCAAR